MKINHKISIRQEVFYIGMGLSFMTLIVITSLLAVGIYFTGINSAEAHIHDVNNQIQLFAERYFKTITATVESLSDNEAIIYAQDNELTHESILDLYDDYMQSNSDITYLYSAYSSGLMLINNYKILFNYDPTKRPWYISALKKSPDISIGLPYRGIDSGEWLISWSKALIDDQGDIKGVIDIDCSLYSINALLEDRSSYQTQRSYIMDQDGKILIHPDPNYIDETLPFIADEITGKKGAFSYEIEGREVLAEYSTIELTGWTIVTAVDRSEIVSPLIANILRFTLISIILSLCLGSIQVLIFGKRFVKPLTALSNRITAITNGEKIETTYPYSNSEISVIASNIEKLAVQSLNKKANELRTIIESSSEGILVVDEFNQILYLNSTFRKMLDIESYAFVSIDEPAFMNILEEKVEETWLSIMCNDQSVSETIYFKNGRIYEQYSCALLNKSEVTGHLWNYRDVTDTKRVVKKLEKMASVDGLTGLYNRRYFMQISSEMIKIGIEKKENISMILFDVDHFKTLNDNYGHAAGDMALQMLAEVFKTNYRKQDLASRIGGEEFCALISDIDLEGAYQLAERFRKDVENIGLEKDGMMLTMTISIGVAQLTEGINSIDDLMQRADEACYKAKNQGRNCTVKA